ncbi:MAG TPA: ABC-2 transporter permease [Propionicimonas sp.]|nr:ABC-2 transporter permease [Propionicimonas sp.]
MINAARFARLELASARVNARQMVILAVLIAMMSWISGNQEPLAFAAVVPLLPLFFVTYPFLADERGRHDLLYATLPIRRHTVVWGRHLYFLVMEFAALVGALAIARAFAVTTGRPLEPGLAVLLAVAATTAASLVLTVQLPVLFAVGFTKSRWIVVLPLIICLTPMVLAQIPGVGVRLADLWPGALTPTWSLAVGVGLTAVIIALWTTSALISVRLYAKRQF